jgi:TolB protein
MSGADRPQGTSRVVTTSGLAALFSASLLLAVLAVFAASATGERAATPARIVFQSDRNGPYDLYSMSTDGSDVRRLTNSGPRSTVGTKHERGAIRPRWSPDGTRIAYTQIDYGAQLDRLVIATSAGATVARLRAHTANGAWSPDGKTLALTCVPSANASDPDAYEQLCLASGIGRGVTAFVDLGQTTQPPTWSPDGMAIAASGFRSSEPALLDDQPVLGRVPRKQPSSLDSYEMDVAVGGMPDWSPDGRSIVYASGWDPTSGSHEANPEIYIVHVDRFGAPTERPVRLTHHPGPDLHPAWSPDGGKIVFARKTGPANFDIFVMDADGSNLARLTRSPRGVLNVAPDW